MSNDNDYAELKRRIRAAGLLDKRPAAYYLRRTIGVALMLTASLAVLALFDQLWIQLLNAGLLAFTFVQLCFLGHDLGHKQVFSNTRANDVAGLIVSALVGINRTWWVTKHNQHHANPNHVDLDPDVQIPVLAFSASDAETKKGPARVIVRHQAWLFYALLCFEGLVLRISGAKNMIESRCRRSESGRAGLRYPVWEHVALAVHAGGYLTAIFASLDPVAAALFIIVNQALTGLYVGATFAPNHKGMAMIDDATPYGFLRRQAMTSRNVRPSPVNDYLYGGLDYQIEHHLFPAMPRNSLGKARQIVRQLCHDRGISYHETGVLRSQMEILQYLHAISGTMNKPRNPATS